MNSRCDSSHVVVCRVSKLYFSSAACWSTINKSSFAAPAPMAPSILRRRATMNPRLNCPITCMAPKSSLERTRASVIVVFPLSAVRSACSRSDERGASHGADADVDAVHAFVLHSRSIASGGVWYVANQPTSPVYLRSTRDQEQIYQSPKLMCSLGRGRHDTNGIEGIDLRLLKWRDSGPLGMLTLILCLLYQVRPSRQKAPSLHRHHADASKHHLDEGNHRWD